MKLYRFGGNVKALEHLSGGRNLNFIPDQEFTVCEERDGKKEKYVVFLPVDIKTEGIVFKYDDMVLVAHKNKAKLLSTVRVGGHCMLKLKPASEKNYEVEVRGAPTSKYFNILSVTES